MTLWLHIASLVLYAMATLVVLLFSLTKVRAAATSEERLQLAASAMRVYDPLSLALLGVMIMTGAFSLTDVKDAMRETFFQILGPILMWKLSLTFVLIIFATYLAFGLGNRVVGYADIQTPEEADSPETALPDAEWYNRAQKRIDFTCVAILVLCAMITWVAGGLR